MTIDLSYGNEQHDEDWGAVFAEVKKSSGSDNIFVCHTTVNDLSKIANELSKAVVDKSWVVELDMDAQACEIAIKLTSKYFGKSLAVALWRAQNDVYQDSLKRPYIMVGPHFQRLRITSEDKAKRVFQNMTRSGANMARSLNDNNKDEYANKKIKENLDFLKTEIELVAKMVSKRYK